jgi:hypothetical protein
VILGVPTLVCYDSLDRMLASAEAGSLKPSGYVIIDNGGGFDGGHPSHTWMDFATARGAPITVEKPGRNLGVAASWNRIIEVASGEPVVIVGDDVVLGDRTLMALDTAVRAGGVIVEAIGHTLFAITRECIERVGWFDENFYPAYCEDCDYSWRMKLAGVSAGGIGMSEQIAGTHEGSSTLRALEAAEQDAVVRKGEQENQAYYREKWGGAPGAEVFKRPFDGHPPRRWRLRGVR